MISFTLTPDHGDSLEIEADSRDIYIWEKTHPGKSLGQLKSKLLMGDLYVIAHITCKRLAEDVPAKLDDFVSAYALDFEEDDGEPDPTQSAASDDQ